MKPEISIIAAASLNRVIGLDNTIPWKLRSDMLRFKAMTTDNIVIMGRKTFESLGMNPLPNRENIVVSAANINFDRSKTGFFFCSSLDRAIEAAIETAFCLSKQKIFIIGGASIYEQAMERDDIDMIYYTSVQTTLQGDTFFPEIDETKWEVVWKTWILQSEYRNDEYDAEFIDYRKIA